jgi:hypothetical protein
VNSSKKDQFLNFDDKPLCNVIVVRQHLLFLNRKSVPMVQYYRLVKSSEDTISNKMSRNRKFALADCS